MNDETREIILERFEKINGLNSKSGLAYALEYFCKVAKVGIGLSRREITRETRELSPFVHSWSTFNRYAGIAKEFVQFCKQRGVNKLHKVQCDTVESFLLGKIERGRRENTLEANMCALQKFFTVCARIDLRDLIADNYTEFKGLARSGGTIHAFDDPTLLIDRIARKHELSAVISELELLTGARIHEVRTMYIEGTAIVISNGKGGKKRTLDFSYRVDQLEKVKRLQESLQELSKCVNWLEYCQQRYSKYQSHVKSACRSLKDEYQGAHGFRANYAQNLERQLEQKGLDREEIELTITRELGHERRSMARHYLSV